MCLTMLPTRGRRGLHVVWAFLPLVPAWLAVVIIAALQVTLGTDADQGQPRTLYKMSVSPGGNA